MGYLIQQRKKKINLFHLNIKDTFQLNRKIKDVTEPSESECISDCRQLDSHWYSLQSGVCICGHADSIILCEEEIGPVVQVFCIQPEKVRVKV